MSKIDDYIKYIEYLADNRIDKDMPNSSSEHAAIVFENIFKNVKNEIVFFSHNFDKRVSRNSKFMKAFREMSERGVKIRILLNDKFDGTEELLTMFNECGNITQLDIKTKKSKELIQSLQNTTESSFYFCVGDNSMVRLEQKYEENIAFCNFNSDSASQLKGVFSYLWNEETKRHNNQYSN